MNYAEQSHIAATEAAAVALLAASHRDYLFRFAMKKVQDRDLADDLVQETLLAAMQAGAAFKGQSTYRVWLAGILKHKLLDTYRERRRYVSLGNDADEGTDTSEALDHANHAMNNALEDNLCACPQRSSALHQLLERVDGVLQTLPQGVAEVFIAKEINGETTEQLSARLGISADNVWVRVHRARKALLQRLSDSGALHGMRVGGRLVMT